MRNDLCVPRWANSRLEDICIQIDNSVLVMEKLAFTFLLEMIVENRKLFLITLFF